MAAFDVESDKGDNRTSATQQATERVHAVVGPRSFAYGVFLPVRVALAY